MQRKKSCMLSFAIHTYIHTNVVAARDTYGRTKESMQEIWLCGRVVIEIPCHATTKRAVGKI